MTAKALKAAVTTYPNTDDYDLEEDLTQLGTGEALLENGCPPGGMACSATVADGPAGCCACGRGASSARAARRARRRSGPIGS